MCIIVCHFLTWQPQTPIYRIDASTYSCVLSKHQHHLPLRKARLMNFLCVSRSCFSYWSANISSRPRLATVRMLEMASTAICETGERLSSMHLVQINVHFERKFCGYHQQFWVEGQGLCNSYFHLRQQIMSMTSLQLRFAGRELCCDI